MSECGGGQHGDTPVASELVGYNTIRGAAERSKKDTGESKEHAHHVLFSFSVPDATSSLDTNYSYVRSYIPVVAMLLCLVWFLF